MGNEIGYMVVYGGGRWEWIIPEFAKIRRWKDVYFWSPNFDAEGVKWYLRIYPDGTSGNNQILITLRKVSSHGRSLSCTVGLKRADHSVETIGTEPCGGIVDPSFIFNGPRSELEIGGWLLDGRLTVTLHFRGAHALQGDTISLPRDIRTEHSKSAIEQDSRWDVSKPPKAEGNFSTNRKVTSRQTQTDVLDGKNERLDGTCTGAEGVMQLSENLKWLLTEQNEDYDVRILVKGKEFRVHSLILKARCPVLGMMLEHDWKEKNSGTIQIEDCDPECFYEFLIFVYCGRAENLTTAKALSLYYAADKYDLPLLKKQCVQFLEASLSATSVCSVVHWAAQNGEKKLLRTATEYFGKNLKTILSTVEWQNFLAVNPTVANELYVKSLQNLGHLS